MSIADLSHHMSDTFIAGPDATRLLAAVSANNYESFAPGQAKQFIPVAEDGNILTDGILLRDRRAGVHPERCLARPGLGQVPRRRRRLRRACDTDPPSA